MIMYADDIGVCSLTARQRNRLSRRRKFKGIVQNFDQNLDQVGIGTGNRRRWHKIKGQITQASGFVADLNGNHLHKVIDVFKP
jgi:hypothetical protein